MKKSRDKSSDGGKKSILRETESILRDSVDYGIDYGLEDGFETGTSQGTAAGIKMGVASAIVNGVEEGISDVISDAVPPEDRLEADESGPDKKRNRTKRRIIGGLKIALVILVFAFIGWELAKSAEEFRHYHWDLRLGWLMLSSLLYLAAYFPAALFWFLTLKWMGQTPSFYQAIRAFYFSQLGKYVPGKAMVVVIRSGMITGKKVKGSVAAVCVFYETLTMMATGAFLSALIVLIWFGDHWKFSFLALMTMFASGIPLLPPVFLRILNLFRIGRKDQALKDHLKKMTWRSLLLGMGLMSILWILFGLSLWGAIHGLGVVTGDLLPNMPRFISVTALAIVLGFAVPISPGGLGIREAVLAILLIPYFEIILNIPENQTIHLDAKTLALVVSLEQRVVSILSEVALAALFFLTSLLHRKRG